MQALAVTKNQKTLAEIKLITLLAVIDSLTNDSKLVVSRDLNKAAFVLLGYKSKRSINELLEKIETKRYIHKNEYRFPEEKGLNFICNIQEAGKDFLKKNISQIDKEIVSAIIKKYMEIYEPSYKITYYTKDNSSVTRKPNEHTKKSILELVEREQLSKSSIPFNNIVHKAKIILGKDQTAVLSYLTYLEENKYIFKKLASGEINFEQNQCGLDKAGKKYLLDKKTIPAKGKSVKNKKLNEFENTPNTKNFPENSKAINTPEAFYTFQASFFNSSTTNGSSHFQNFDKAEKAKYAVSPSVHNSSIDASLTEESLKQEAKALLIFSAINSSSLLAVYGRIKAFSLNCAIEKQFDLFCKFLKALPKKYFNQYLLDSLIESFISELSMHNSINQVFLSNYDNTSLQINSLSDLYCLESKTLLSYFNLLINSPEKIYSEIESFSIHCAAQNQLDCFLNFLNELPPQYFDQNLLNTLIENFKAYPYMHANICDSFINKGFTIENRLFRYY